MKSLEIQHGGSHYKKLAIQPVEFIVANDWDYFAGNTLKYLTRWRDKGGTVDLRKARHYIDLRFELHVPVMRSSAWRTFERIFSLRKSKLQPISMEEYVSKNLIPSEEHHLFYHLDEWVRGLSDESRLIASMDAFINRKTSLRVTFNV